MRLPKITRYYITCDSGLRIGPFFRRKAAERAANGSAFFGVPYHLRRRFSVQTRAEWLASQAQPEPPEPREPSLIAYARAHVTSPGAHALLDEVERGQARRREQR
jgi:hypothetical protein